MRDYLTSDRSFFQDPKNRLDLKKLDPKAVEHFGAYSSETDSESEVEEEKLVLDSDGFYQYFS